MNFEKLDMKTVDFTDENIAKLAEIFPNVVSENEEGKAIDFEALKQELSGNIIEGYKERYSLNWAGKKEAQLSANTPTNKTLRPCISESVDFDTTENLYIEGDNLEVLKILQESYMNKIKMIYIDPPYNTGKDFVYKDNFTKDKEDELIKSGQKDEDGGRLVSNLDSNGRYHSDWLSMMYPRLKLARNLLHKDGIVYISIDDNEAHNLRKICDEIFGEKNFVGSIGWESKTKSQNTKDSFNKFQPKVETIYVYAKRQKMRFNLVSKGEKSYEESDENGDFRYALIEQMNADDMRGRETMIFPIHGLNPAAGKQWKIGLETVEEFDSRGDIVIINEKPYRKMRTDDERNDITEPFWGFFSKEIGTAESGKKELSNLIDKHGFDTVKPTELISKLIYHISNKDDIVLDFFSGSATTAHSVMKLNSKDNGSRKFIMVQIPEETGNNSFPTICEIGKERIRRAGKKIFEESGKTDLDIGFRVLKLDSSNMKEVYFNPSDISQQNLFDTVDNIKEDRSELDLLYGILIDWGVDLTLPIVKENIQGKDCYFVDEDSLCACFEDSIDEEFIKELASKDMLRVVFKDSSFGNNDDLKDNVSQIFKQLNPNVDIKVI